MCIARCIIFGVPRLPIVPVTNGHLQCTDTIAWSRGCRFMTGTTVYIYTSWIPGFARDPLSRSLSPSLSRPSLPSLLFVPAFYPPSLGLPGFAQDNCIPEIPFKPWSLVTLTFSPLTPPPRRMGWGGGYMFWLFFRHNFCFYRFSRQFVKFPALLKFWPPPQPPPPRESGPPGVGWVNICFIDFLDIHGSHLHWLIESSENDVITSTDQLWRHLPHNGSQKKLAAKSRFGDWPQWPHASRPFMGPIFGRNHSQVYPHMRAKFGHDRSSSLAAYTWQTDTHTEFVLYRYRLAGYPASLETLSPGLSPPPSLVPLSPLSYSSLPSTLAPSDYPASLRITAFPRYFLNLEA